MTYGELGGSAGNTTPVALMALVSYFVEVVSLSQLKQSSTRLVQLAQAHYFNRDER